VLVVLVYAVVLIILAAVLMRRDLSSIGRVSFRGGWILAVIVAGLFLIQATLVIFAPGQSVLQMAILVLSQVALILLILINRHIPGAKLFALGIILNTMVMVANGGWMPVTPGTAKYVHPTRPAVAFSKPQDSKNIILPRSETKLWILSDIIRITLPWRRNAVSVGDILLIIGAAQFIFQTTSRHKSKRWWFGQSPRQREV
jgi:hypothetical protein